MLNHGHLDDLNLNYFGLGFELTYDLGYGLGSTHTQVGWAKQTASHQLVLVDETRQLADAAKDDTGGSLHLLASMPGMQVVNADANYVYRSRGVETYRRFSWRWLGMARTAIWSTCSRPPAAGGTIIWPTRCPQTWCSTAWKWASPRRGRWPGRSSTGANGN